MPATASIPCLLVRQTRHVGRDTTHGNSTTACYRPAKLQHSLLLSPHSASFVHNPFSPLYPPLQTLILQHSEMLPTPKTLLHWVIVSLSSEVGVWLPWDLGRWSETTKEKVVSINTSWPQHIPSSQSFFGAYWHHAVGILEVQLVTASSEFVVSPLGPSPLLFKSTTNCWIMLLAQYECSDVMLTE